MSPMYGYKGHRGSVKRQKDFMETVLSESTNIEKETENGLMDTGLDNPCYQSSDDLSNEKVDFFPITPLI